MQIIHTNDPHIPAQEIAQLITKQLSQGRSVVWFVSGGSAISVAVLASTLLEASPLLHIVLADERYGPVHHSDSNYQQLLDAWFTLPIIPILTGKAVEREAAIFAQYLYLHQENYLIGLFGMGNDGHTAGILPNSAATVMRNDLVFFYPSDPYYRVTVTPYLLTQLASAHLWVQGSAKLKQLQLLQDITVPEYQPAQYLKQAKSLTLYY